MTYQLISAALVTMLLAGSAAAQAPLRPPRDTGLSPERLEPAAISGRIVAAESGAPLRRVQVVATMSPPISEPRTAWTGDDGTYELTDIDPGNWQVVASKNGYTTQQFGQRRPFDAARPVVVGPGVDATADFALLRAGAIAGRVYDEYGDPVAGAQIQLMRARMIDHRRYLQRVGATDSTDDTGAYRLHGLPPGEYYVAASLRVAPVESIVQTTYSPTYYPGTGSLAEAQRVLVASGSEVAIDFPILPFRTARITGTVVASTGSPGDALLNLSSEAGEFGIPLGIGGATQPDGSFTLPDVPPGTYTLNASLRGSSTLGAEVAAMPVSVHGDDLTGLTLVTAPPATVRGTVVVDAGLAKRLPDKLSVLARSTRAGAEATYGEVSRGAFGFAVPAGPIRFSVEPPSGWMLKAILVAEQDATDLVLDLNGQQNVPVRIVLTDRGTEVTGTVGPVSGTASVVVFADDAARWEPPSRYVQTARVDERGSFRVTGLPGGRRYLAVALDDLEPGEGDDPEFLARIRDSAVPFELPDAGAHTLELRAIQR